MGLLDWFTKRREEKDAEALARAEEHVSGDSRMEEETWSGDMQGLSADNRAARRLGGSAGGLDRFSE